MCRNVRDNLTFATGLLIEGIYDSYHKFTAGSNIVSINMGRMTKAKARQILHETPFVAKTSIDASNILNDRLKESIAIDFPGVFVEGLSKYAGAYTPIMGKGGNSLYHTLSILYKTAIGLQSDRIVSNIAVTDFCLLCFHLNGQYLLTANAVTQLWSGALRNNSIATLQDGDSSTDRLLDNFFS